MEGRKRSTSWHGFPRSNRQDEELIPTEEDHSSPQSDSPNLAHRLEFGDIQDHPQIHISDLAFGEFQDYQVSSPHQLHMDISPANSNLLERGASAIDVSSSTSSRTRPLPLRRSRRLRFVSEQPYPSQQSDDVPAQTSQPEPADFRGDIHVRHILLERLQSLLPAPINGCVLPIGYRVRRRRSTDAPSFLQPFESAESQIEFNPVQIEPDVNVDVESVDTVDEVSSLTDLFDQNANMN